MLEGESIVQEGQKSLASLVPVDCCRTRRTGPCLSNCGHLAESSGVSYGYKLLAAVGDPQRGS